jgi:hypothetical protein
MFSPGLPELCHEPSTEEIAIWDALDAPAPVEDLLSSNTSAQTLAQLLKQGTIEYAD